MQLLPSLSTTEVEHGELLKGELGIRDKENGSHGTTYASMSSSNTKDDIKENRTRGIANTTNAKDTIITDITPTTKHTTGSIQNLDLRGEENKGGKNAPSIQNKAASSSSTKISQPLMTDRDRDHSILYVHVGKTGGITLDRVLRSNCEWWGGLTQNLKRRSKKITDCLRPHTRPESVLSHLTKKTIHMHIPEDDPVARNNITSLLFTVRNPIARAISAFNNDHPKNWRNARPRFVHLRSVFYEQCFSTIEDLATVLADKLKNNQTKIVEVAVQNKSNVTSRIDCFDLGMRTLQGKGVRNQNMHLLYNYNHYARPTVMEFPEKEVFVIRTESLWKDVEKLNMALAETLVEYGAAYNATVLHHREATASLSTFKNITGFVYSHGSEKYGEKSGLSREGKEILCCVLSKDNQVFEDLVRRAANLEESEKERYLEGLYSDCGISKSELERYHQEASAVERGVVTKGHVGFSWVEWSISRGCGADIV